MVELRHDTDICQNLELCDMSELVVVAEKVEAEPQIEWTSVKLPIKWAPLGL